MLFAFVGAKNDYFDATDSWHGYTYQGKIALLVAMEIINKLYEESKKEKIKNYYLEIEWLEDFSILYSCTQDQPPQYFSIHQVKAREDDLIDAYSDALETLARKVYKTPTIQKAFLHTETSIKLLNKTWINSVKHTIYSCNSATDMFNLTKQYINDKSRRAVLLEQFKKGRQGRLTKYAEGLLNFYREKQNDKKALIDETTVLTALTEFEGELATCVEDFKHEIDDNVLRKIECRSYTIDGKNHDHCPAESINILLENEIYQYYLFSNALPEVTGDKQFASKALKFMLSFLDDYIAKRHVSDIGRTICLFDIERILHDRSMIERNVEFYLYHLKDDFYALAADNCRSCKKTTPSHDCSNCQVPQAIEKIKDYSNAEFEHFLLLTFPHINKKLDSELAYKHFIRSEKGYESPFFEMLEKTTFRFEQNKLPLSYMITHGVKKRELHLLAALRSFSRRQEQELETFCRCIIENIDAIKVLYDYDAIICKDFPLTTLARGAGDFWKMIEASSNDKYREHIYYLKDIKIVPIGNYEEGGRT
ncbi:ABC-three component system protein [Cloacibacillus porcorum]|uniref:ABC-three component system protein n=1 Tax=Cloacibacillus porcorum TaxID=1197717 RepID=UPI003D02E383